MSKSELVKPIGVFDAGIGSYDIAHRIAISYPHQDLIYFGDRASFPYGNKSHEALRDCIKAAFDYFLNFDPAAIVLASNAPSIMVLDELKAQYKVPIIGVRPPLERALSLSKTGYVGVMGVDSLISSPQIRSYVQMFETSVSNIELIQASDLVDLVENGSFLNNPMMTKAHVAAKLYSVPAALDVITLSSTHLPWLRSYFEEFGHGRQFIDPADDVVSGLAPYIVHGTGRFCVVASHSEKHTLTEFRRMLAALNVSDPVFEKDEFRKTNAERIAPIFRRNK